METQEISPVPQVEIPLIEDQEQKDETSILLDESINKLYTFLRYLGFNHTSLYYTALSCFSFFMLSIIAPLLIIFYSDCDKFQIRFFEIEILVFQAIAAAVSLFCISHNLRKYGLKILLFVKHHYHQHLIHNYVDKLYVSICFFVYPICIFVCLPKNSMT